MHLLLLHCQIVCQGPKLALPIVHFIAFCSQCESCRPRRPWKWIELVATAPTDTEDKHDTVCGVCVLFRMLRQIEITRKHVSLSIDAKANLFSCCSSLCLSFFFSKGTASIQLIWGMMGTHFSILLCINSVFYFLLRMKWNGDEYIVLCIEIHFFPSRDRKHLRLIKSGARTEKYKLVLVPMKISCAWKRKEKKFNVNHLKR